MSEADAAWVKVVVPLTPDALYHFLGDIERLFRLNPCLEFERFAAEGDAAFRLAGRNESNGRPFAVRVEIAESLPGRRLALRYDGGLKRETRCDIEPAAEGAQLTITETYATPADPDRLADVDRSLVAWAAALRAHIRRQARWGGLPGYAWCVRRGWLTMPPRQRRIARLLVWTSVLEFVVFLFVVAIFWSQTRTAAG